MNSGLIHFPDLFGCIVGGFPGVPSLSTRGGAVGNLLALYKLTGMKLHICKYCGETFDRGCLLGNHVSKTCSKNPTRGKQTRKDTHVYSWKCSWCDETFDTRRKLQSHRRTHYTDEWYAAHPGCNKNSHANPLATEPCRYCGKVCKYVSGLHLHEKCCPNNPARVYLRKQSEIMSDETKKKISESLKQYYSGRSIWYTAETHRQSYAERYFSKIFVNASRNYHVDRYFLDFAWPDKHIYIEVDGEQHYTEDGIKRDTERTNRLNDCGWRLITRIRWSEYQKMTHDEQHNLVHELLNIIANYNNMAPERIAGGMVANLPEAKVGFVLNGDGIAIPPSWCLG